MNDNMFPTKGIDSSTLRQLQLKCLEILDIVVKICQDNDIIYSLWFERLGTDTQKVGCGAFRFSGDLLIGN